MTKITLEKISIANLIINPENFRYDPVQNQRQAIEVMVKEQKDKIENLAEDIAINGLNPSEFITVGKVPDKSNTFIVLEGNRRVTALKLLNHPELLSGIDEGKKKKFMELRRKYLDDIINKPTCVIYENHEESYRWIELKHTGSNNGVGVMSWGPAEKQRFIEKIGKKPKTVLQVINYINDSNAFDEEIKAKLDIIPTSNLQRLIDDPDIRAGIGLDMNDGDILAMYPEPEIVKGLSKIIDDLALKKINVKDIYYKEDRKNYLETFKKHEMPDERFKLQELKGLSDYKKDENEEEIKKDDKSTTDDSKSKKDINIVKEKGQVVRKNSTDRRELVPKSFKINIDKPRINDIFRELKSLDLDSFTNSVAVLFRVFIELSSDEFIYKVELDDVNENSNLSKKVQSIAEHMRIIKILNKQELRPINKSISSPESILSFTTLNAYVHNKDFYPSPNELKITWNNMEIFIEKMWEIMREVEN